MHIGERIAAHRKRRGLSQEALAGLVGRSRSWLSQVERGLRDVDKLSTVTELALVLQIRPADLVPDVRDSTPEASRQRAVEQICSQLAAYGSLVGEDRGLWPLPQVRNAVVEVHRSYQAASYDRAAAMLPDLIAAADAYSGVHGSGVEQIQLARCSVYAVAAKLLTKLGESQAAWLAADRAAQAAVASASATAQGMAAYQVACALLRNDRIDEADNVAAAAAERLMVAAASGDRLEAVSLAGANWLLAAVIAARRTDRAESRARLATAASLAERLGRDANHAWTAFGPTNVEIHAASAAAELGDPRAVLEVATRVDPDRLPSGLTGRRAQTHIDLAWAQTQARNESEAILHHQQVDRLGNEIVRHHTVARQTTRELLKRSRRPSPALTVLATRAGILG